MKFRLKDPIRPEARQPGKVFVFGSNIAGIHGAGAAQTALCEWGARWGRGIGHWGASYAIPTKVSPGRGLSLAEVAEYVRAFLVYAECRPDLTFLVTPIGTGLAGFRHEDIAPLFRNGPDNVLLPPCWRPILHTDCESRTTGARRLTGSK